MGTFIGLVKLAGTIYIFYNAWKGTPKKFLMKIFCIIFGFFDAYTIAFFWIKEHWGTMLYWGVDLILIILIPFAASSLEKRNKR